MSRRPSPPRFSVVGCSECNSPDEPDDISISHAPSIWILENKHLHQSAECPRCGTTQQTDKLAKQAQHDDWYAAAELRSKILADKAGRLDEYEEEYDEYATLDDNADAYLGQYDDRYSEQADAVLGTVGVDELGGTNVEGEALRVAGTVGEEEICRRLGVSSEDLDAEVDRVAGNVVSDAEICARNMDRFYGSDRDAVTLDGDGGFKKASQLYEDTDRAVETDIRTHIDVETGNMRFVESAESIADARVTDATTATEIHKSLFGVESQMVDSVLEAAAELAQRVGRDPSKFSELLKQIANPDAPTNVVSSDPDITQSVDGLFGSVLASCLQSGDQWPIRDLISDLIGNTAYDVRTGVDDVVDGPLSVLAAASSVTPTVLVSVPSDLFEWKSETRENYIRYLCALGRGCDLKVVATPLVQQRIIWETDRDLIPEGVAESTIARHTRQLDDEQLVEAADEAISSLGPTAEEWDILQIMAEGRTDEARYGTGSDLLADPRVDKHRSTVSTYVGNLENEDLIDIRGPQNDKYAVVTPVGKAALDTIRPKIGKQSTLTVFDNPSDRGGVGDTLVCDADLCSPEQGRDGGTPPDQTAPQDSTAGSSHHNQSESDEQSGSNPSDYYSEGHAPVVPLSRWEHDAVVSSCTNTTVAIDNVVVSAVDKDPRFDQWTVDRLEDKRSGIYSYNDIRDELVTGAEFHDPLQFVTSLARSMVSDLALNQILTPERLDGAAGDLDALINGDKHMLRDKRCLGWLKNSYDGESYQDALRKAREELCDLTYYLKHNDFEGEGDKWDFRGEIMQFAHGLIGTVTGIYDLLGVDVYRTIRIPGDVKRNMGEKDIEYLQKTLVRAMTISSKMGAYTQSRVHFETDEDRRKSMGNGPEVDANDPTGTHIGSWSIVGHDADTLQSDICSALENPDKLDLEYQDDGENFVGFLVDIPITVGVDRETVCATVKRSLSERNMQVTSHAVSVMQAFCGSTHAISKAIYYLGSETYRRKVRVDELKEALKHIPSRQILPSAPTPQSKIVHALIRSPEPLSQSELCDRAGISPSTFAGWGDNISHRDHLSAFDLIRETDEGWAVCLRYKDTDLDAEAAALPWYSIVDDESSPRDQAAETGDLRDESLQGALYEAMLVLEDSARFSEPEHPLSDVIYGRVTAEDLDTLIACRPDWEALIHAVVAFRQNDPFSIGNRTRDDEYIEIRTQTAIATTGKPPDQDPITDYDQGERAVADD